MIVAQSPSRLLEAGKLLHRLAVDARKVLDLHVGEHLQVLAPDLGEQVAVAAFGDEAHALEPLQDHLVVARDGAQHDGLHAFAERFGDLFHRPVVEDDQHRTGAHEEVAGMRIGVEHARVEQHLEVALDQKPGDAFGVDAALPGGGRGR